MPAAVNGLFKNPLKHIGFLLKFVAGAFIGFIFFAKWITFLLSSNNFGEIIRFLFMGIVIGGIPLLVNKSGMA